MKGSNLDKLLNDVKKSVEDSAEDVLSWVREHKTILFTLFALFFVWRVLFGKDEE